MDAETRETRPRVNFDNSYARLPERFAVRQPPTPVATPRLVKINEALALDLGIDPAWLASPEGVEVLAGSQIAPGSEPLALAYAGHQFGNFVPQLGDGRAILLGEVLCRDGRRCDLQLKGSGQTPFSRRGDGRAALGPVLREYIVSEAMAALGIPTTRTLAAVTTGEPVFRETVLPGAVLARVAASHIRVGTFQYFAARKDTDAVRMLADYAIDRHYPEAARAEKPYLALLDAVIAAQAELVAGWMGIGFIHGVMNTDNCTISGETIDYGPCAFMDTFDSGTVFSSIDMHGRYAFANQPRIAQWNMARFAECLIAILDDTQDAAVDMANASIAAYKLRFEAAYVNVVRTKLGLTEPRDGDLELAADLFTRMAANEADFTLTFRALCDAAGDPAADAGVRSQFNDPQAFDQWATRWRERMAQEAVPGAERRASMRQANPRYIPRNHRVEQAIAAAVSRDDFAPFEALLAVVTVPFEDQPANAAYADPPKPHEVVTATFCGT